MELAALCGFAFLAGFIDAIAGGGGLVQVPALFVLMPTVPAATLLGTNKFSSIWGTMFATWQYSRQVPMEWNATLPTCAAALVFALVFVFVPLLASPAGRTGWPNKFTSIFYFSCLGAGFIIIELTLIQELTLLLVAMLTSKGASGVTGAGFITLSATLAVVPSIPVAGLALILGIDRFMSEARSLTNFIGNGVATLVVSRWERELDQSALRTELQRRSAG